MGAAKLIVGAALVIAPALYIAWKRLLYMDCLSLARYDRGSGTPILCFDVSIFEYVLLGIIISIGILLIVLKLKSISLMTMRRH